VKNDLLFQLLGYYYKYTTKGVLFWETTRAQHMCMLAKVDALLFWKKYWPRALVVDKISATTLLEGFRGLVG
jgi:hypothetical protein